MVGDIIPEWWAASSRIGGRHHPGMMGDLDRNQQPNVRDIAA